MLSLLKSLNIDRLELDDMVALVSFGNGLETEYAAYNLTPPEWLKDNLAILDREIKARWRENEERALKLAVAKRSELRTAQEKREELDVEIEERELRLGLRKPAPPETVEKK